MLSRAHRDGAVFHHFWVAGKWIGPLSFDSVSNTEPAMSGTCASVYPVAFTGRVRRAMRSPRRSGWHGSGSRRPIPMIRIAITPAAFEAIAASLPLGSVATSRRSTPRASV